jgi:hypothetical protein
MDSAALIPVVIGQLRFAREYTLSLLADMTPAEWFLMPPGAKTHLAWQVGHLAMAEYGLCLFRVRGRLPEDLELMPSKFRKQYSRGSTPDADPANQPSPDELLATLAKIHEQALAALAGYSSEQLNEPTEMPYAVYPTKLGALFFCPQHEMIHAGQIGLLRRLLGKEPVR